MVSLATILLFCHTISWSVFFTTVITCENHATHNKWVLLWSWKPFCWVVKQEKSSAGMGIQCFISDMFAYQTKQGLYIFYLFEALKITCQYSHLFGVWKSMKNAICTQIVNIILMICMGNCIQFQLFVLFGINWHGLCQSEYRILP